MSGLDLFDEEPDQFAVAEEEAGERIDKLLALHYGEGRSRSYFQYLISAGCVLVNGKEVKKRNCPEAGDSVEVRFLLTPEMELRPEEIPLDILYEDEFLLAVNKPAGMVVHPAPGNWSGTFANALLFHCSALDAAKESLRPGIVHRLDKETSGLLIAAKTVPVQQLLMELFAQRKVSKEYLAVCLGNPGSGVIEASIGRDPHHRKKMKVLSEGGRSATTRYTTLSHDHALSLVSLMPVTGRTHQLRLHMSSRGHPILGDSLYGNEQANKRYKAARQLLHAWKLSLPHPVTGALLKLEAPIPADLNHWITTTFGRS